MKSLTASLGPVRASKVLVAGFSRPRQEPLVTVAARFLKSTASLGVLALLGTPANAGDTRRYLLESDQLLVAVQVGVGKSQVSSMSHALDGAVAVSETGGRVKLSIPVASFASGNPLVDAALAGALEAGKFPEIEFEGESSGVGREATVTFNGTLTMHGVSQPAKIPVRVVRDGGLLFVHLLFSLDASKFGVTSPSLGGVSVSDRVEVQIAARLHQTSPMASN
jgi:polyisoprenoid-binding protein YceI